MRRAAPQNFGTSGTAVRAALALPAARPVALNRRRESVPPLVREATASASDGHLLPLLRRRRLVHRSWARRALRGALRCVHPSLHAATGRGAGFRRRPMFDVTGSGSNSAPSVDNSASPRWKCCRQRGCLAAGAEHRHGVARDVGDAVLVLLWGEGQSGVWTDAERGQVVVLAGSHDIGVRNRVLLRLRAADPALPAGTLVDRNYVAT